MWQQGDLISDTQRAGFEHIRGKRQVLARNKVFDFIRRMNGATLFEICFGMKWAINRVSGRVTELKDEGRVFDSGLRRKNPTSGKPGIVWKVKGGGNG